MITYTLFDFFETFLSALQNTSRSMSWSTQVYIFTKYCTTVSCYVCFFGPELSSITLFPFFNLISPGLHHMHGVIFTKMCSNLKFTLFIIYAVLISMEICKKSVVLFPYCCCNKSPQT